MNAKEFVTTILDPVQVSGPCRCRIAHTVAQAREVLSRVGLPVVIFPSYTLGPQPIGVTEDAAFEDAVERALMASPTTEVLIEPAQIITGDLP